MTIVTKPLVPQIANGQVGDAVPLMALANYIADQVNANAQPVGVTPTILEWQSLGQTPTFINATSFSAPGDLTATLIVGRRLQTLNTAGTIYSTIRASVFTSLTTVTVINDSGVLDSGLSAVNFGILSPINRSVPTPSAGSINNSGVPGNLSTGVALPIGSTGAAQTFFDQLSEWAAGVFTAKQQGLYLYQVNVNVTTSGVTWTSQPLINFTLGGGTVGAQPLGTILRNDFPTTGQGTWGTFGMFKCPAGGTIQANIVATFTAGTVALANYQIGFARVGA